MVTIQGRTWLEILPPPECWGLLAECRVGRIAFVVDGEPEVLPVNFVVDGHTVVFRTDRGTKLDAVEREAVVAFEVDHADDTATGGWSVVLKGHAEEIRDPDELRRVRALPLRPWAYGEKAHWVRLVAREISGRRVVRTATAD